MVAFVICVNSITTAQILPVAENQGLSRRLVQFKVISSPDMTYAGA